MDFSAIGVDEDPVTDVAQRLDLDVVRPRFEGYKNEAQRIVSDAKEIIVQDQEGLNIAVMIGGNAKKIAKAIDVQRKATILEPSEFVRGVNAICKTITDALDEAERVTKQKIGQYQAKAELERREAERKAREAAEALQRKLREEAEAANRKAQEEARKRAEEEQRVKREREEAEARERGAKAAELKALADKAERERLEAIRQAEEEAAKNAVEAPTVIAPVVQDAPKVTRTEAGSASQRKVWTFEIIDPAEVPREFCSPDPAKIRDAVKMGGRMIAGVRIFEDVKTVFRS